MSAEKLRLAELEEECVDLRLTGLNFKQVGARVGLSASAVYDAVERVYDRKRRGTDKKADMLRQMDADRLDVMLAGLWKRATDPAMATVEVPADNEEGFKAYDGQDKAVDRVTKILERRAKLLGLDAPVHTKLSIVDAAQSSPDFGEVYRIVCKVLDARFPGATALLAQGLDAYRESGERGVDAFLAGDMALEVTGE